jgi:uncharacterized protein (TIGR04255 family)
VGEVALAAYFDPLEDFQPIHLGALRAKWRDRYPGFEQHPEAPPVAAGEAPLLAVRFSLQLFDRPPLGRAWFVGPEGSHLVQFQRDRLIHNWRRMAPEGAYPRYRTIVPQFSQELTELAEVVAEEGVGALQPTGVEVTYINVIPVSALGPEPSLARLLAPWSGRPSDGFLPVPEDERITASYRIPGPEADSEPFGYLNVNAERVIHQAAPGGPSEEQILLQVFARGRPLGDGIEGVLAALDLGHEWVVRGFRSLTTPEMHGRWGLEDA